MAPDVPRPLTMGVVVLGTLLVALNLTTVNVALPAMGRDFGTTAGLDWVVSGHLLAVGVAQPLTGWLSARFGSARVYVGAASLFAVSSLLVAAAPTLGFAVVFRILQGFGGGALMPVGMAIVHQLFPPHRRSAALGTLGMAAMAGPALGPVAGGWIVAAVNWRVIFLVNLPLGLLVAAAGSKWLRNTGLAAARQMDWLGLGLVTAGLSALLVGSSWLGDPTIGVAPAAVMAACGSLAVFAFALRELRTSDPLLDLRIFKIPSYSLSVAVVCVSAFAHFVPIVLVPVLLQAAFGAGAMEAGLVLAPSGLGAALFMAVSGRLADRIGPRWPVVTGMLVMMLAALLVRSMSLDTSLIAVASVMGLHGVGAGMALMTVTSAALNAVPTVSVNEASAIRSVARHVGAALSVGVVAAIITHQVGGLSPPSVPPPAILAAYQVIFLLTAIASLLCACFGLFLPGRRANRTLQERRIAEHNAAFPP